MAAVEARGQTPFNTLLKGETKTNTGIINKDFLIATYNVKSLNSEQHLIHLENALKSLKWDILGISEVRRFGEDIVELKSGHIFSYFGQTRGLYGVGFLVNSKWKSNILEFKNISERVAILRILVNKCKLSLIQVYAPTSKSSEQQLEKFYGEVDEAISYCKSEVVLTMGDFNASLGHREENEQSIMGPFGYGSRNERGYRLIQWLWQHKMTACNSLFKKRAAKKWTWAHPNENLANNKFEIDYIMCNKTSVIQDVEVINHFSFNSDHRLLRAKLRINHQTRQLFKSKTNLPETIPETSKMQYSTNLEQRRCVVYNPEEDLQSAYDKLVKSIKIAAESHILQAPSSKPQKFSQETLQMVQRRDLLKRKQSRSALEKQELRNLNHNIKIASQNDIKAFNQKYVMEVMSKNGSIKKASEMANDDMRSWITNLEKNGKTHHARLDINEVATVFYESLFKTKSFSTWEPSNQTQDSEILPFLISEVSSAILSLGNEKSGGTDGIKAELLKFGIDTLSKWLCNIFNKIIREKNIPQPWLHSEIILLHKKGSKSDMNNYRPISMISTIYKVFSKCLLQRLKYQLSNAQSIDQAAFKSGFSTCDHLQCMNQLIEKCTEYQMPIYFAFIDFKKAFDTIEHNVIWSTLEMFGVPIQYIELLRSIYANSTSSILTDKKGRKFPINRGVKQGDPISPLLFSTVLEGVFRNLEWQNKGININGNNLNNLRFADDIVLISNDAEELQQMVSELQEECAKVGLEANEDKTKVMTNSTPSPIKLQNATLEYVKKYVYLGQLLSFEEKEAEVERRISNAWKKFWSLKDLFNLNLPTHVRKYIFDSSVLPILTYGCQMWNNCQSTMNKLIVCQRSMERALLKISIMSHTRATDIRSMTNFEDVIRRAKSLKWDWAGHIIRLDDNRWTKLVTEWTPYGNTRRVGRQQKRWRDELKSFRPDYQRLARDRTKWKELGEQFKQ